jgi:hypothetical protein
MTGTTATADRSSSSYGTSFTSKVALGLAAFAIASGTAAWIADFDPVAWISASVPPNDAHALSFDDRFRTGSVINSLPMDLAPGLLRHSLPPELESKFQQAKRLLAENLRSSDQRAAPVEEPAPPATAGVPLPKPRPVETGLALNNDPPAPRPDAARADAARPDDRTLLQKLSDLLPARVTLASLAPDGGLFNNDGPDLTALGYDKTTAVYDISARAVYMPNGAKLEAHSGMGALMDDPRYVSERNVGATPPNVYDLKPRERPFHGVKALRMIPQDDKGTLGRVGLLAHSYMLGPNGDSNGCVSIKSYDKFLRAFENGEINRLVVVTNLNNAVAASRRADSQS